MRPAAQNIAAIYEGIAPRIYIFSTVVKITLQSNMVLVGGLVVNSKSALGHAPGIRGIGSIGIDFIAAIEIFSINPVENIGSQHAAITNTAKIPRLHTATTFHISPLGVFGVFGHDIDH